MIKRTSSDSIAGYTPELEEQLEQLLEVFAKASVGDFSQEVAIPEEETALTPLLVGVQVMLDAVREKISEAELLQDQLAGLIQDRTEALKRSQSYFRSVVQHAPTYIEIADADLNTTFVNRLPGGLRSGEVLGKPVGHLLPEDEAQRIRQKLRKVIESGEPAEYELWTDLPSGERRRLHASAGPVWHEDAINGIVIISLDVTEDWHRMEALEEGRQIAESARVRDRTLLNSIGEGLIVIDDKGRIATANPSALRMLGYTKEEVIGEWFPRMVLAVDEAGQEINPIERPAIKALSSGQIISEAVYYRRRDGSTFPVAITISPVVINGKPQGAIEVFRDLTHERELEQAKEEFVSLASHQLRTPATGVKAYVSMLLDGYAGKLSSRQLDFVRRVFESNERQLRIINDMLNVARADAGRIIPEMVSTDLGALIQDIVDEQRPTIRERRQDLVVTLPTDQVEGVIDPRLIRMVIENIVSNSSKYTLEGGTITIQLAVDGGWIVIRVEDNGVGIAKEDLPKLFKRFSRIDNPLSTKRGGSGLGLYLAQTIVLLHKGRLTVDSERGVGTIFCVELPQAVRRNRRSGNKVERA